MRIKSVRNNYFVCHLSPLCNCVQPIRLLPPCTLIGKSVALTSGTYSLIGAIPLCRFCHAAAKRYFHHHQCHLRNKLQSLLTLRLHYVPGDHGSHGSPKRSAPCDLVIFCLGTQVLLSIITFRHGLSRYPLQTVG